MPALTIREQILAAVRGALSGLSAVNIFRNLTSMVMDADFPAVVMFDGAEDITPIPPQTSKVMMNLDLELFVKADTEAALGPAMNALLGQVSAAMWADETFGGLAVKTDFTGMAQPVTDKTEGETPAMGAVTSWSIEYWVNDRDLARKGLT